MKLWYALTGSYYDAWDVGSYDLKEAYTRLMLDSEFDSIAVIDEEYNFCLNEFHKGDLDYLLLEGDE